MADGDKIEVHTLNVLEHIRGLGLDDVLENRAVSQGMVDQKDARFAAGVVVQMAREDKIAGCSIFLAGEPSTGKTGMAVNVAQALDTERRFKSMSGSEIYSLGMNKTEDLSKALRKIIGVRIKEKNEIT